MKVSERLSKLRELMAERGITAYIEPTADPHQSEYVADHYKTRAWISGFTGSAGIVVITQDEAILWTDGRYFIQAEKQIADSGFELYKMFTPGYPTSTEWLNTNLKDGDILGFNGKIYAQSSVEKLEKEFKGKDIKFVDEYDLIGELWEDRPAIPKGSTFPLDTKYSGKKTKDKLEEVRNELKAKNASYYLLSSLDDIAWLYNIRGNDVANTPVVISYALVTLDNAYIFVDREKVDNEVEHFLKENGVEILSYEEIITFVDGIDENAKVILEKDKINRWLYKSIPGSVEIIDQMNITTKLKGVKNSTEIENQRKAYIKDCVALVKFFNWIDKNIDTMEISEISAQEKLLSFREEQENFIEPSFDTISAYKENAAMMHYSASETSNAVFKKEGLYLVDSGGQYYEGTTDITRTVALGHLTNEEKKDFTLTLKGHINLISARFLAGTSGHTLDILSRYPLWQEGIDYKCGTGHGVGYLLGVHEGPHRIASAPNNIAMEKGMIVTIEPGVYKEGSHGIRIENVVVVDEDIKTDSGQFMKFDVLSYCPIDLDCIDKDLLSYKEKNWLNNYHAETYNKLSPYLNDEEKAYLRDKTKRI